MLYTYLTGDEHCKIIPYQMFTWKLTFLGKQIYLPVIKIPVNLKLHLRLILPTDMMNIICLKSIWSSLLPYLSNPVHC